MAVDTAAKRYSIMNLGLTVQDVLPIPDGSDMDSAGQRQHMLLLYSGIAPAVPPSGGSGTSSGFGPWIGVGI